MIATEIQVTTSSPAVPAPAAAAPHHGITFHEVLSALNPLQYLPVVGTIYRAATGDVIPEALRRAGSFVVSGLLGGPIGLLMSIGSTIVEKVTGLDPDKILASHFASAPAAGAAPQAAAGAAAVVPDAPAPAGVLGQPAAPVAADAAGSPERVAVTPQQLAAYGVRPGPSGIAKLGDADGADVLNGIELVRLGRTAAAAYSANLPRPVAMAAPGA